MVHPMKMKIYAIGLVSIAALGLCVSEAAAWFWNGCCNRCCSTYICCRPYNAFTPVCFGNVTCDGCCPLQNAGWGYGGGGGCCAAPFGAPGMGHDINFQPGMGGPPTPVPSNYVPPAAPLPV